MALAFHSPATWFHREMKDGSLRIHPQPSKECMLWLDGAECGELENSLELGRWSSHSLRLGTEERTVVQSELLNRTPFYYTENGEGPCEKLDSRGSGKLDDISMRQYFLAGYVTGPRTLFRDIRKSQAGEVLRFAEHAVQSSNSFEYRYPESFRALTESDAPHEAQDFLSLLDQAIRSAVESLAPGQKIIVPLSGGHDSRLLVSRLASMGVENVLCFSYGRPDNEQSRISKRVAESLGYPWHFVEYTEEKWQALHDAGLIEAYARFAFRGSSIPHLQDFLAVHELRQSGLIAPGDLCMPGHTLDFVSGGHIAQADFACHDANSAVNRVLQRHFPGLPDGESELIARIHELFEAFNGPPSQFQEWFNWRERQTKFIVNSCATYEFHDMKVALPFWDIDVVRYWLSVAPEVKAGRKFYFLMEPFLLDPRLRDIPFAGETKTNQSLSQRAQRALRKRIPTWLASRLVSASRLRRRQNEGLNLAFARLGEDIRSALPHLAAHPIAGWPPIRDILCRRPYQLNGHRMAALYTLNLLLRDQANAILQPDPPVTAA